MLRFSANLSLLFTELPLTERFAAAKQAGFAAVEIQFPYELPAEHIQRLLLQQQLELVLFNVPADDLLDGGEGLACVPEKQAQFKAAIALAMDYAQCLKPDAINVLPGRCLHPERLAAYRATLKQNLAYAADTFAGLHIKTLFEAINLFDMPGFIVNRGEDMLHWLAEVGHPNLAMQYDVYHAARMNDDYLAFLSQHADKIGHIQFADCPGRGQPGTGTIDFARLFRLIAKSDYRGWVGAEYKPQESSWDSLAWYASFEYAGL